MTSLRVTIIACMAVTAVNAATASDLSDALLQNSSGYSLRAQPQYSALGIRFANWLLMPTLKSGLYYDSNLYKAKGRKESSVVGLFAPALTLHSDVSRHSFQFGLSGLRKHAFSNENASTLSGRASANANVEILSDFALDLGASIETKQFELGAADASSDAQHGVRREAYVASARISKVFNRLRFIGGASVTHHNYHDVSAESGGVIDQDYRDGTRFSILGKMNYAFSPGLSAFASAEYNARNWKAAGVDNRDSQGIEFLTGLEVDKRGNFHGVAGVGYLRQDYDLGTRGDISTYSVNVDLQWMPSPLLVVNFDGRRSVEESSLAGHTSKLTSKAEVSLDYEFLRNLIISPVISYKRENYSGVDRRDDTFRARLETKHLINRNLKFGAYYDFETLKSTAAENSYSRHLIGINAKVEY
ncbi:outer membrane beta-barrel protein [Pseudovibrio brasiliensis]|uniref:Outer membrane beta-barrel protein n=1 Tax=Pseudovibrio brasiliensis TaxID=1898042 RepID=A0ABX8AW72_9HYPH|nr:outer membrane beta-barrel protein [Pseudovibrio brasiliensis]QUS58932.1 outer membrane beta-barrel protein [Pseudovibrio brasiliensis]